MAEQRCGLCGEVAEQLTQTVCTGIQGRSTVHYFCSTCDGLRASRGGGVIYFYSVYRMTIKPTDHIFEDGGATDERGSPIPAHDGNFDDTCSRCRRPIKELGLAVWLGEPLPSVDAAPSASNQMHAYCSVCRRVADGTFGRGKQ